jgi:hypothetical protein
VVNSWIYVLLTDRTKEPLEGDEFPVTKALPGRR